MKIALFKVDAFTDVPFRGNPAAVCLLTHERSAEWMQQVAMEMNLSETAFVVPAEAGFQLRWFTPETEVRLCGHATLASAHVLFTTGALAPEQTARFATLSGVLEARRDGERIAMDLPAFSCAATAAPPAVLTALGVTPRSVGIIRRGQELDYLFELASSAEVRAVRPDFPSLRQASSAGYIVTARTSSGDADRGDDCDFVSRYFAPAYGIDEDPVTGAAHCALIPYWSERLGKSELVGYQASRRGGKVYGQARGTPARGDRVRLSGAAVTILQGELWV